MGKIKTKKVYEDEEVAIDPRRILSCERNWDIDKEKHYYYIHYMRSL